MPRFRVTQAKRVRVTYEVAAENEDAVWAGDVVGVWEEVDRDEGEYLDTIEVEALDAVEPSEVSDGRVES